MDLQSIVELSQSRLHFVVLEVSPFESDPHPDVPPVAANAIWGPEVTVAVAAPIIARDIAESNIILALFRYIDEQYVRNNLFFMPEDKKMHVMGHFLKIM